MNTKPRSKKWGPCSGMTMLELLIVTAITVVFSLFVSSLFILSRNAWEIGNASLLTRDQAKRAIDFMMKELRESSLSSPISVQIPASPANTQICFAIPNQVSASQIDSWTQIIYQYDPNARQLLRQQGGTGCAVTAGAAQTILARNVQSVTFSMSSDIVSAAIETRSTSQSGFPTSSTMNSHVVLRN